MLQTLRLNSVTPYEPGMSHAIALQPAAIEGVGLSKRFGAVHA
jgi:hypothetical protein